MPIKYAPADIIGILAPITFNADGSASIVFSKEAIVAGSRVPIAQRTILISKEKASLLLDQPPVSGLTRRDDIALAIYQFLVESGEIEAGLIT